MVTHDCESESREVCLVIESLLKENNELISIFVASVKTAKQKDKDTS
jgi:hypothetical protein